METILFIFVVLIGLCVIAFPVKIAAVVLGAKRTGMFWCLVS